MGIRLSGRKSVIVILFFLFFSRHAQAGIIKDKDAIRAIVGEAENQQYKGMLAVAEAIRNRGSLNGVYGFKRDLSRIPKKTKQKLFLMAARAWTESVNSNLVRGANHWENIKKFGTPKWASKMKVTAVIKDHTFFKQ